MMGHSASSAPALSAPATHELTVVGLAAPALSAPATHAPTVVGLAPGVAAFSSRLECPCRLCHKWRDRWAAEPDSEPHSSHHAHPTWEDPCPHSRPWIVPAIFPRSQAAHGFGNDVADPESEPIEVCDLDLVRSFHFEKWCSHLKAFCLELWWLSSPRARLSYLGIHPRARLLTNRQIFHKSREGLELTLQSDAMNWKLSQKQCESMTGLVGYVVPAHTQTM